MDQMKFCVETISCANKRDIQKPNEDFVIADGEKGIFILLDGITRPHEEYRDFPGTSAALEVSELFAKEVYAYLADRRDEQDKEALLRAAAAHANGCLLPLREQKSLSEWGFYPATIGIICLMEGTVLHYLACGDCVGALLRGSSRMLFGKEFALEGVDLLNPSKAERYEKFCNRQWSELAYTVFNGDACAPVCAEYSHLQLEKGDVLLLASDGVGNTVKFEKQNVLKTAKPEDLLVLSEKYDLPPFGSYADDKSIIRISCC